MKHNIRLISKEEYGHINELFLNNRGRLLLYAELLLWWNGKVNLVSRGVSRETIIEHIKHSLYVTLFDSYKKSGSIIDTGSGGGLPSIPLALCDPLKYFVINDIVSKKIFAVKDMLNKLNIKNKVSTFSGDVKKMDVNDELVISKHAFKIDQLVDYLEGKTWTEIIFLKGYSEAVEEYGSLKKDDYELEIIKLDAPFISKFYEGKGVVKLKRV